MKLVYPFQKRRNVLTLVEDWVVRTAVQPSPMVNSHEIESPYEQELVQLTDKFTERQKEVREREREVQRQCRRHR